LEKGLLGTSIWDIQPAANICLELTTIWP